MHLWPSPWTETRAVYSVGWIEEDGDTRSNILLVIVLKLLRKTYVLETSTFTNLIYWYSYKLSLTHNLTNLTIYSTTQSTAHWSLTVCGSSNIFLLSLYSCPGPWRQYWWCCPGDCAVYATWPALVRHAQVGYV